MPRVKLWAGGGACPQGYPVPAFRFSNELDLVRNINTFFRLFTSILQQQDIFNFTDHTKRTFKFDFTLIDNSIKLAGLKNNTYIDVATSAEGN